MKKMLSLLLTLSLMLGLAPASLAAVEPYGEPWLNSNVYGMITEEVERPRLQDDFYLATNYDYLKDTKLTPGHVAAGPSDNLANEISDRILAIMKDESVDTREARLVRELYQMFLDWEGRAADKDYVLSRLKPIEDVKTMEDLSALLVSEDAWYYLPSVLKLQLDVDPEFPEKYMIVLAPTSLSLSDSSEYAHPNSASERLKTYQQSVGRVVLQYLGRSEAEANEIIEKAFAFEAAVASSMLTTEELRSEDGLERTLNFRTLAELKAKAPNLPLEEMLAVTGYNPALRVNLMQPAWLEALNGLYTQEHLEGMRAYLLFHAAMTYSGHTDEATFRQLQKLSMEFNGIDEARPDEVLASETVRGMLSDFTDRLYIALYGSEKMKSDVLGIMREIVASYKEMLQKETWLSEETRAMAIRKLDNLRLYAAYPDKWTDQSKLTFTTRAEGGSYARAADEIGRGYSLIEAEMSFQPVDPDIWVESCTSVNAYYAPDRNSINILAGILGDPFYSEDMSREEMLGGIGAIIGHEISHGFDSNAGSLFDENGSFKNWWTDADRAAYSARTRKLIEYYNGLKPWRDGSAYSGTIIQGETIADMGGVACVLNMVKDEKDFDYDAFFRSYSRAWLSLMTGEVQERAYRYDPHPLNYLRVNVVLAQFDAFQKTYNIQPGDGMYVAPADRIAIWGADTAFTDVSDNAWYRDAALWAADKGVVAAGGSFGVGQAVTGEEWKDMLSAAGAAGASVPAGQLRRADAVASLCDAVGGKAAGENPFTDVSAADAFYDAALWAYSAGVVNGTGDGAFSPELVLTRAQAVTMLYRQFAQAA